MVTGSLNVIFGGLLVLRLLMLGWPFAQGLGRSLSVRVQSSGSATSRQLRRAEADAARATSLYDNGFITAEEFGELKRKIRGQNELVVPTWQEGKVPEKRLNVTER